MLQICFINSPLGIIKIIGDENGISIISVSTEGEISETIPKELQESVSQLQEYFEGKNKILLLRDRKSVV